ncbi:MAG: cobalamin biosynthesis protein CobD [Bacteroidaceae bacterium]|nr:cobalamin biosynthesis protein CobD [Bacteroidaceae bacterium]
MDLHVTIFCIIIPLLIGWSMDMMLGDPEGLPHPIVFFGKWIAYWEKLLNHGAHLILKGALTAVCSISLTFIIIWFLMKGICHYEFLYIPITSIGVFYCLAGHTLRREVRLTFEAVDESIERGRAQVGRIVGRDTANLSAQEIRTAALETLAENLSDGVIAPLFWYALLGLPGMMAYKMVNTLDSMIGYQNERYKQFGCWAAHIDDIANYIPARISAVLILLAYKCHIGFRGRKGFLELWAFTRKFGPQHASPNSGWPEAALAGILDCQFGGSHNYFGKVFYKPHIGTNPRNLITEDMQLSIHLVWIAEILAVLIISTTYLLAGWCLSI